MPVPVLLHEAADGLFAGAALAMNHREDTTMFIHSTAKRR
jgi:hypothetical protein